MDERHEKLFRIFASQFIAMLEEFADQLEVDDDKQTPWEAIRHLAGAIRREEDLAGGTVH